MSNFLVADWVVLFPSLRAVLTAVAVLLIVWGQFEADRLHDGGIDATNNEQTTTQQQQSQSQPPSDSNSISNLVQDAYTALSGGGGGPAEREEGRQLRALWRGPAGRPLAAAAAGWWLLIAAAFVDAHARAGFAASWCSLGQVGVLLWLLVTQAIILPLQVADRAVHENGVFWNCAAPLGYGLWGVLLSLDDTAAGGVPWPWSLGAAACAAAAWPAFWYRHRRRGDAYDRCGVENPNAALFAGVGGPLLAAGWCGLWLSLNAVRGAAVQYAAWWAGVPIYWTRRAQCALLGAALVTAAQWAVDHAHDEHRIGQQQPQPPQQSATPTANLDAAVEDSMIHDNDSNNNNNDTTQTKNNKVFLLNGVLEIRIVHCASWCVLAVTAFLPTSTARWKFAAPLFVALVLRGCATSQQHVAGLRAGSELAYQKWQRAVRVLDAAIAFLAGLHSGPWALGLSAAGAVVQQAGRRQLHRDRKRGAHWMSTQQQQTIGSGSAASSSFTVYSYGVLLVPTGMLIWAWGLSMP